uniref:Uncharacterized protein n=1 Tax=Anguilla anguilla TaxID=7936 RepID=A0A0E9WB54_ANGAN
MVSCDCDLMHWEPAWINGIEYHCCYSMVVPKKVLKYAVRELVEIYRALYCTLYLYTQWPTIEDCSCTGQLPGVNVYECEAGRSCK